MYRVEIFDQGLRPVDAVAVSSDTTIVDDFVSLETYEVELPKIVNVERGHLLRFMDDGEEIAIGVVTDAEQTNAITRVTAAPLISLLDFDTLEPAMKYERTLPYPPVWFNAATNYLMADGVTSFQYRQTAYINIYDTGAFLVSALATRCRDYIGSGATDPTYTINDFDVETADRRTNSNNTIDGVASDIGALFNPDKNANRQLKTVNVFEVFSASRTIEGRTFTASFDFTDSRPRLRIYMRRSPANTITIDADAPNIIEKEINIATDSGAANRCNIYLVKSAKTFSNTSIDKRQYYRHPDGSVDMNSTDTITPVIAVDLWVDYDNAKTTAENEQYCDDLAAGTLSIAEQSTKVSITVQRDDRVLEFDTMRRLSSATILHNGKTYTANYTGCRIHGALVTYIFGDVRTEFTSKVATAMRKKGTGGDSDPFDPWDAAVPQGYAMTSNNGVPQISGGSVSAVNAYGAYIIANVGGLGYTSVTRTHGNGQFRTIKYDGTLTGVTGQNTLTLDESVKWVIAHRTGSSQAVLSLSFS